MVAEESDETLVRKAGRGDRDAAALLVERHTNRIYAVCYRMLGGKAAAEDAAQETFLRLWKNAHRWEPKGAKFQTWLIRIAMNYCLDQLRKSGREAPEEAAPEQIDTADRPDDSLLATERKRQIGVALEKLPARQRLAITLCHFEEMSNIEAAKVMDVSVEAIESLLSRARRSLRDRLSPMKPHLAGRMSDESVT